MKQPGDLTAAVARQLSELLEGHGVEVLFDHGDSSIDDQLHLGQIASWFGEEYRAQARLALIDIAFVRAGSDEVLLMAEVEETSADPKVILGDAFGTLLGDHLIFKGKRGLIIGSFTSLIIMINRESSGADLRIQYLEDQINRIKDNVESGNAILGKVAVRAYSDEDELRSVLYSYLKKWLVEGNAQGDWRHE